SRAQNRLILSVLQHTTVSIVSDGENVRRQLLALLASKLAGERVRVDAQSLVRIDNYAEETRVCLNEVGIVSIAQIVEHRGLVEASHVGHVLRLIESGRIGLLDVVSGYAKHLTRLDDSYLVCIATVYLLQNLSELEGGRLMGHPREALARPVRLQARVGEHRTLLRPEQIQLLRCRHSHVLCVYQMTRGYSQCTLKSPVEKYHFSA
ncbi:hypothetical protein PFISCL1PPCAC_8371, partial [Pristionchus fissidentatus]